MPKLVNVTPKYRHHRGTGQAFVRLDGRDVYLGRYDSDQSRAEYARLIAAWLANKRRMPLPDGPQKDDPEVVELIDQFWTHAESYYGGSGHRGELGSYRLALRVLNRLNGHTLCKSFGPNALKLVRQAMIDAGWSRTYVNRQTGRLKHVFKWGVQAEIVPVAVWQTIATVEGLRAGKTTARESEPVRPVPDAHVDVVKPYVGRQVWGMIELQRLTGMRPGEVTMMRGRDIDTTGELWEYRPPQHKTAHHGHKRIVPLGPKARAIVEAFLKPDLSAYLFSPAEAEQDRRRKMHEVRVNSGTPLDRGNRPGTNRQLQPRKAPKDHYTTDSYRRAIQYACDVAFGLPEELRARVNDAVEQKKEKAAKRSEWRAAHTWHPHQLRHNYATTARKLFGLEAASIALGHENTDMTEIYAEQDLEQARKIALKIG